MWKKARHKKVGSAQTVSAKDIKKKRIQHTHTKIVQKTAEPNEKKKILLKHLLSNAHCAPTARSAHYNSTTSVTAEQQTTRIPKKKI